ncbi:MAG: type IV pilus secretin PilQ, partial [Deltaproteobacteria bacterium]|nr:type IV pilus secretin PilQ [Deltaproteobacteria bacterium]
AAAASAHKELASTRTTLADVEKQRTAAETAAGTAARKRSEAEAAATDAARRRGEAEVAVAEAAKKRRDAEDAAAAASEKRSEAERERFAADQRRKVAEEAAATARSAAEAADQQRKVAETAARAATDAKKHAEASLAELNTKRAAAERAAADLETRSKAEAKAQAELAAAQARKAGEAELAKVRTEVARLESDRRKAESELADRRKAVAAQQAEAARLESTAAEARDSATRAEARRAALADQAKRPTRTVAAKCSATDAKAGKCKAAEAVADAKCSATDAKAGKCRPADAVEPRTKPAVVNDIAFKGSVDGSAQVDIAMTGDAQVSIGEIAATHVELIVDHADLGATRLERKLDVSRFGSPVRAVSSFRDRRVPGRVRMIAELAQPATPTLDRDASGVHWRFVAQDAAPSGRAGKRVASASSSGSVPTATTVPTPKVSGFGAASTPVAQQSVAQLPPQASRRRVYRGATVDFDFVNANIHDLLRVISDTGRVNIVVPDTVDAKVTVRLKRVPWDQALEVILASKGLWYRREGNLIRVADRKDLDKEDELEAARRAALVQAEVPRPEIVPLNYASAKELPAKLKGMLSPKGNIEVDERTNQLIITDVAGNREQIARLALLLDTQTPQIAIEARIVEARSTFLRQFGIQWGGSALAGVGGGNATGLVFPASIALVGGNEDAQTVRQGIAIPSNFAINLPAATGSGEGGAFGLQLGSVGGNLAINLRLSALEDSGTVRIISAPKVTVLNNKKASIKQGVSIPISVISAAGTQTQFVQADLSLEVTPSVSTRDCAISMELRVEKNEPDFVNVGARGDPTILRKEAVTSMLVADGETSVLGGIYTRNSGLAYKKFPFLAEIPVFGWLFKNRRENDDRTEILVFITPKITNKQLLRCQ